MVYNWAKMQVFVKVNICFYIANLANIPSVGVIKVYFEMRMWYIRNTLHRVYSGVDFESLPLHWG